MANSHTPGPWTWAEDRMNGGYSGLIGRNGEEVMFPAHRNEGDDGAAWFEPGESISEADAKLIAAAPDLLAACDAFVACVLQRNPAGLGFGDPNHNVTQTGDVSKQQMRDLYELFQSAIAKATSTGDAC